MQNTCKIAISIPKEDFEKLEELRREMEIGRSEIVDTAIRFWLGWIELKESVRRYEVGYRKKPEKVSDLSAWERAGLEALRPSEDWSR